MVRIDLTNIKNVKNIKNFIAVSQSCTSEVFIVSGKYRVNAKSILGLFSLDLSNPVSLICEDENDYPKFKEWTTYHTAVCGGTN